MFFGAMERKGKRGGRLDFWLVTKILSNPLTNLMRHVLW
jgi:hypothetical protein